MNLGKIISVMFSIAFGGFGDFLLIQQFINHPESMPVFTFAFILVVLTSMSA